MKSFVFSERYVACSTTEIAFPSVCLSVRSPFCVSVCIVHHQLSENRRLFPEYIYNTRPGIWLDSKKNSTTYLQPCFPSRSPCQRDMKKLRFPTNISLYLGNDTRYGRSYNGRWIGTCKRSTKWRHFQRLWVTPTLDFKVTTFFNVKITRKRHKIELYLQ